MNSHSGAPSFTEDFWSSVANKQISWYAPWKSVKQGDFRQGSIQWFVDGKLNVCFNCVDRHLPHRAEKPAIIWEGDEEHEQRILSFAALHEEVCRMANALKKLGIHKGDTVAIYLPMIPEAAIAMLACARIGAIHTVVFAGFSAHALRQRIQAAACKLLITADGYQRGGKFYALKEQADEASANLALKTMIIRSTHRAIDFNPAVNFYWDELREQVSNDCPPEWMDAEDPLFILYTSGSTGQPKGLVHTSGGYIVQTTYSHQLVFGCKEEDVFWCTADVGWITGHSYVVYGPLGNGTTTLMYAGIPNWPNPSRCWKIIDKYKVNVFYTAPTALRALKRAGDEWLNDSSRTSLRLLGTVGEPINPEVWEWYYQQVGAERCPVVDTWWQTETGAIMISEQPPYHHQKPGSASQPLPGIFPILLSDEDEELHGAAQGTLAIKFPWPSMARTIQGDHERYRKTYFRGDYYITGDGARRDEEGNFWLLGRIDDVLNVSGHRLGTAEIESALVLHPAVAEAAVVGIPHPIKGEGVLAFVSLKTGYQAEPSLKQDLMRLVIDEIGAIAKPENILLVTDLPKTRSGKIMRRILRLIAAGKATSISDLGDISTLSNPQVVEELLRIKIE
ncbi:acetyl-coenzyme A synthetase [Legionella quinlivanii]|uniref:Acetate--CoA ligase n=1 Tax=Legionella quinlivanii TaxID=45073 RepID=A0A0W0XKM3_9GAMM|nr:acetate--CoA ligase [Legionella quinlivanii]KTD45128.1 acetyl-coenzyme A synthetase [Legionella quinlivanii]SEG49746.1 acetyl-coenzyme A synthetase [Legionella quinlivanii DSM 21216]STY09726.1 acetyl-CoA synthetase [Legionella quinlivanii]